MGTVGPYREIVERLLTDHARIPFSHGELQLQTVFDRESDHFLLMVVGREGGRRVHGCLVHIDLIEGKIWIQRDGTEYGIAKELLNAGVPQQDIILGFRSSRFREEMAAAREEAVSRAEAS
jgi:hypothetical protein